MYILCVNTLLKVLGHYDLSVLSMSVIGFQKSLDDGGGRPANSHGLPVSFTGFYSPTAVATVAHGFILAPPFYFHIDSCQ